MSDLRSAVYVAPPIPFQKPDGSGPGGVWSPISCTLIYSATAAVLVDTPITVQQTEELIAWIEKIAPSRKVEYIYITHGHGDHFFGIPQLLQRWPDAKPVATPATLRHMQQQVEDPYYSDIWECRFPGQIHKPFTLAQALPQPSNSFELERRWECRAVEVGHADTYDSSVLWVPALRLAVCGDVVYGQVHQMLAEANTAAKRAEWIRAVEKVEALEPAYVVPGHRQAEEIDGVWHLASTKKYIQDFGKVMEGDPEGPKDVFEAITKLYPERFNPAAAMMSSVGAFRVPREQRI